MVDSINEERKPLTGEELESLDLYSELHDSILEILLTHGEELPREVVFKLEDALLKAVKPSEDRRDFVEFSMLSVGAPHLIRAVENTWPHAHVFVDQFQNPESIGVQLNMVIHESLDGVPSLAETILDKDGKINKELL